ncbi:MAG: glycosyltransferase [Planctomycetota bacterium]
MKVALCCSNFPPEFAGGTEKVVEALARSLVHEGDEVMVIAGSDRAATGEAVRTAAVDGFVVHRIERRPDEPYDLDVSRPRIARLVRDLLKQQGTQCVHVHAWAGLCSSIVADARADGRAAVATLHDLWVTCPRFFRRAPAGITCPSGAGREECIECVSRDVGGLARAELESRIAQRDVVMRRELLSAGCVTVPSRATARRVAEAMNFALPIEVVPHGLIGDVARRPDRPSVGDGPTAPIRVGHFGNLVPDKGVDLLVRAAAGVPALELVLAGRFLDPAYEAFVRSLALDLGVAIECRGPYGEGTPHPTESMDLAVFPSLCEETYGLVVDEALAAGVPVLVSDKGALGERIGGAGRVVDVRDQHALHRELLRLATDRSALAELTRAVPAHFPSIRDAAVRYRELYRVAVDALAR